MKEMTIQEVKQCSFNILLWFDAFCKQHNLCYWLCGGTLLGAVRHKGFIPWDDDIDIMMPRLDYERLATIFPLDCRYELNKPLETQGYPYSFTKISDSWTIKDEIIVRRKYKRIGVDVDVFPIDNLPDEKDECLRYYRKINTLDLWLYFMNSKFTKGRTFSSTLLRSVAITIARIAEYLHLDSSMSIIDRFNRLSQKYNSKDSQYWGITSIGHYGINERNFKNGYYPSITVCFEGHEFPAPASFDQYLSQLYGKDYMEIPPIETRMSHHTFRAYWK